MSVECCQVEVSASGRSLVRRSPTKCGVSECDREASIMRRPWPTGGCCAMGKIETKIKKVDKYVVLDRKSNVGSPLIYFM